MPMKIRNESGGPIEIVAMGETWVIPAGPSEVSPHIARDLVKDPGIAVVRITAADKDFKKRVLVRGEPPQGQVSSVVEPDKPSRGRLRGQPKGSS